MIRFCLFSGVVLSLYLLGQREDKAPRPEPRAIPMTVSLSGTRIAAPERREPAWTTGPNDQDAAPAPRGFDLTATTFPYPPRLSPSSLAD